MLIPTPTHRYTMKSPAEGVTFVITSYRELTRGEALYYIALRRGQRPKPRRGTVETIVTTVGLQDSEQ